MDTTNERCLALTDADLEVVASVYALINDFGELVVEYSFEDERNARRNFCKRAIVDSDDTRSMATFFRLSVAELPQLLDERCGILVYLRHHQASHSHYHFHFHFYFHYHKQ